jgi:AraC family transcriptional regulator
MFEAEIKHNGPLTVAFKVMRGDYSQTPDGFQQLYDWVEHYGLQPVGMPQALFLTLPSETPEGEAEWELWAPIAGGSGDTGPDEDGFGVKRLEPDTFASAMHKGPYDEIAPVYEQLGRWVEEHGYRVVGPPREVYYSDAEAVAPQDYLTEVQMPVIRA